MKVALAELESLSPYSPSRRVRAVNKEAKETFEQYEAAIWRDRAHWTAEGRLFIPPMAFKRSLETAAAMLRIRIPGKGQSEYGKHFLAGILVPEGLVLPITRETIQSENLFLSSAGKKGKMDVLKTEPVVPQWTGEVRYYVLDDTITESIFEQVLREAGNFVGIGRFRPINGGFYGRYKVLDVQWETQG